MNSEQMTYLKEVFGYDDIDNVDDLTWQCIEENAEDGHRLDQELLQLRKDKQWRLPQRSDDLEEILYWGEVAEAFGKIIGSTCYGFDPTFSYRNGETFTPKTVVLLLNKLRVPRKQ